MVYLWCQYKVFNFICYAYDAWGNFTTHYVNGGEDTTVVYNTITYRSYYYDAELGFYYLTTRYYDANIGRFISADNVMSGVGGDLRGYNLYAYCFNNPVMYSDHTGNWPSWLTKLVVAVAVVVTVAAVAAITVATAGAGTVAATIAVGAAKGAAIGMATGAAIGATTGYLSTGTLEGTLNGMADGALSGAITGTISGAVSSGVKIVHAAKSWGSTSGRTSLQNMNSHFQKHVINEGHSYLGKNVVQYTNNAKKFFTTNQSTMKLTKSGNYAIRAMFQGQKSGGFYSLTGKIFSFF